jgi:hypothetical protein
VVRVPTSLTRVAALGNDGEVANTLAPQDGTYTTIGTLCLDVPLWILCVELLELLFPLSTQAPTISLPGFPGRLGFVFINL